MYKMLNANAHLTLNLFAKNMVSLYALVCKTSLDFHVFKCICFFDPVKRADVLKFIICLLFAEDLFGMTTIIITNI